MVKADYVGERGIGCICGHHYMDTGLTGKSVVLDLGANRGLFAAAITTMYGCKCHAVEPNPSLFAAIPSGRQIIKHQYAIAHSDGPALLTIAQNDEASHIHGGKAPMGRKTIIVKGIAWASLWKKLKLRYIDLLKLDIEGAEVELLESIPDMHLDLIRQITVEFHDFCIRDVDYLRRMRRVMRRLEDYGFGRIDFSVLTHGDVLFINRNKPEVTSGEFLMWKYYIRWKMAILRLIGRWSAQRYHKRRWKRI